jgi:monothiol glutaredoxin
MPQMPAEDCSEIFSELNGYDTIIAYDSKDWLDVFDANASGKKIYVDLGISQRLKEKFLQHYGIEKLPCMIKLGCKVYLEGNCLVGLEEADRKVNEHYQGIVDILVNTAKVFIFIKGRASDPTCKFTRQLLSIFEEQGLVYRQDFLDFDILSDEGMRERLKVLNNWPTYPQIFVKGKFIGGLDTIRGVINDGAFSTLLG